MSSYKFRFAPSPTGFIHQGNLRVLITNYLLSKHFHSHIILRVDDTDAKRNDDRFLEYLFEIFKWLGIEFDFIVKQSERLVRYKELAYKLISEKKAYFCFCSANDLKMQKEEAKQKHIPYRYPKKCRYLSKNEIDENLKNKKKFVIRLKTNGKDIIFNDLNYGKLIFNTDDFGDFIIMRSNGYPSYNFASIVDDLDFEISHIVRGEDHISNTPKQIVVSNALGKQVPHFCHLPLILDVNKKKLSKRNPVSSFEYIRSCGIIPESFINYEAILTFLFKDKKEIFSIEELVERVSFDNLNKNASVFDKAKLFWLNKKHLCNVDNSKLLKLIEDFCGFVMHDKFKNIVYLLKSEVSNLKEMCDIINFLRNKKSLSNIEMLILKHLNNYDVKEAIKLSIEESGLVPEDFYHSLRKSLIGQEDGISVAKLLSTISLKDYL